MGVDKLSLISSEIHSRVPKPIYWLPSVVNISKLDLNECRKCKTWGGYWVSANVLSMYNHCITVIETKLIDFLFFMNEKPQIINAAKDIPLPNSPKYCPVSLCYSE